MLTQAGRLNDKQETGREGRGREGGKEGRKEGGKEGEKGGGRDFKFS